MTLRVVLAFAAFKETLGPREACLAAAPAFDDPVILPIADGGDGTLDVFPGSMRKWRVTMPLSNARGEARYRLDGDVAILEMAEASGLKRIAPHQRNPLVTTSKGTGELILAARRAGAKRILLGAGGSATVDAGLGALEVLDHARDVTVLCDVETTLLDAPRVFGPQKGATPAMMAELEARMRKLPRKAWTLKGGGAAGGLAAGLATIGAKLVPGAPFILRELGFARKARGADLVITGEGRLDRTSLQGKAVGEIIGRAKAPVVVICGSSALTARQAGVARVVELGDFAADPRKHAKFAVRKAAIKVRDDWGR